MKELQPWIPWIIAGVSLVANLAVNLSTTGRHEGIIESLRSRVGELEGDVKVLKDRDGR